MLMQEQTIEVRKIGAEWTVSIRGPIVRRFADRDAAIAYAQRAKSVTDRSKHKLDLVMTSTDG